MKTISKAQRQVLALIAAAGEKGLPTSRTTVGVYVAGTTASALRRRGLAKLVDDYPFGYRVAITEAGRAAHRGTP